MSSSDLANAIEEISIMADSINFPRIMIDKASRLLKAVHKGKNLKGHSTEALGAACLYIVCRREGIIRPFKEFCAPSKIGKKEIGRCFKLILKALKTSVDIVTTSNFMPIFCIKLELRCLVQRAASQIAREAVQLNIVPGRSAVSVASAAIYMATNASNKKFTKKEIGDVTGVADVSISQSYELMYPHALELFPDEFELDVGQLPQP